MPTPLASKYEIGDPEHDKQDDKPNPNAHHQNSGVLRVSTMELICSLTVSNVAPGAHDCQRIVGIERSRRVALPFFQRDRLAPLKLRIWIAKLSQIGGPRARVQLRVHGIVQFFGFQPGDPIRGLFLSPKTIACVGQACIHAV